MKFKIIPNQQTPKVQKHDNSCIKEKTKELVNFVLFASKQENTVGLSANQVSLDGERFMIRAFAFVNMETKSWDLAVNPVIKKAYGINEIKYEGCLTWKGMTIIAKRARKVDVSYHTLKGEFIQKTFKGLTAQIFQHEMDHLNGIEEKMTPYKIKETSQKIERNAKCPCGSGQKYKNCCLV